MTKSKKIIVATIVAAGIAVFFGAAFLPNVCTMEKAFEIKAENDLKKYSSAIQLYKSDYGNFPRSLEELKGLYLVKMISDPWGNGYEYISDGKRAIIFSYGDPKKSKFIYHVETKKI